jgi:hypothetical protein
MRRQSENERTDKKARTGWIKTSELINGDILTG